MKMESASGILLLMAAILAMIIENTPLSVYYDAFLTMQVEIRVGNLGITSWKSYGATMPWNQCPTLPAPKNLKMLKSFPNRPNRSIDLG